MMDVVGILLTAVGFYVVYKMVQLKQELNERRRNGDKK